MRWTHSPRDKQAMSDSHERVLTLMDRVGLYHHAYVSCCRLYSTNRRWEQMKSQKNYMMRIVVFWLMTPFSLVDGWHFGERYFLCIKGRSEDGCDTFLRNICNHLQEHTRPQVIFSPPWKPHSTNKITLSIKAHSSKSTWLNSVRPSLLQSWNNRLTGCPRTLPNIPHENKLVLVERRGVRQLV